MRGIKRLFYYVVINIVISGLTILVVLNYIERRYPSLPVEMTPLVIVVTTTPVPPEPATSLAAVDVPANQADVTLTSVPFIPTSTLELLEYIVKTNDTLGSIASQFEVSIEDIIYVNQLANPDMISVGQILYIPVGGLVIPTSTIIPPTIVASITPVLTVSPTSGPSPTASPTLSGQEPQVYIDNVIGMGDLPSERIIIRRSGLGELSLAGWQLQDQEGNVYFFPQLTLYEGGAVNLNTRSGTNTYVDLFWNLPTAIWNSGDIVSVYDTGGNLRATYTIP